MTEIIGSEMQMLDSKNSGEQQQQPRQQQPRQQAPQQQRPKGFNANGTQQSPYAQAPQQQHVQPAGFDEGFDEELGF
jgi:single-stranded DNA-binding protein